MAKCSEQLPPGWTLQFKAQKAGRKVKYYINRGTGQKFNSKADLFRYVKVGTLQEPQPTNGYIRGHTEKTSVKPVRKDNENPEWLPDGWVVDSKFRKSGALIGRSYKIYIDPATGFKFFSKPEVLRYLESVKHKSSSSKRKKIPKEMHSASNVVVEKSTVDDFPPGWVKENKIRKTAYGVKRDLYYINLGTGQKFNSKKDLLRYVKAGTLQEPQPTNGCIRGHTEKTSVKPVGKENENPDWLPDGWVVDSKFRKSGVLIGRSYKIYIDPATGFKFFSKPEVLRYLESVKHKSSSSKRKKISNEMHLASKRSTKRQKLKQPTTRRQLFPVKENSNACSSALSEAKALKKRQGKRVSAESGLAGANTVDISPEKMVIEKSAEAKEISSLDHAALPKTECSNGNQSGRAFAVKGLVSTPATESMQGEDLLESGKEWSNKKSLDNSNKSGNNRKLNLPCRSSKRLAGLEPELVHTSVPIGRVSKKATTEPCKSEAIASAGLTSNGLPDEVSNKLNTGLDLEVANCASPKVNIRPNREQSDMITPSKNNSILGEAMQKLESMRTDDENSEPCLSFPLGDTCLDQCLEFAVKTLTGQIPVDLIPDSGPVSTPPADILQEKSSQETKIEKRCVRKTQIIRVKSKKKKELNLPRRFSKRIAGLEPELVPNMMSSAQALYHATRKSSETEVPKNAGLDPNGRVDVVAKQLEAGHVTVPAQHDDTDVIIPLLGESSNKGSKPHELQTVSEVQCQKPETDKPEGQPQQLENEKVNNENAESQLLFPFGDSWSDPCLEFAYKTLTGVIPVDENFAVQEYFQHQLHHSRTQIDGRSALPDFGLPSSLQSDVTFTFDASEKQPTFQQQLPVNPSFLPSGNVSLPSCSSVASQQPPVEGNKEINGRVKS